MSRRDGGMATRADYDGIVSIGITRLEAEAGPLIEFNSAAYYLRYAEETPCTG